MNIEIEKLGRLCSGGSADLLRGRVRATGKEVVLKYPRDAHLPHVRNGFHRELRILKRGIPGCVPVVCEKLESDRPWYATPYFKRGSLTAWARKLPPSNVINVAMELAIPLGALHAALIWHGDFKPDNVLVWDDGRLYLADPLGNGLGCTFALSQHRGGTPGYCAPEIMAGGDISAAGDVFSYGASLHHLVSGCAPRNGQRFDTFPGGVEPPEKLREVIAACCVANPDERPSIPDVLRILRGEEWTAIQEQRRRLWQLLGGATVGAALLGLAYLACKNSN